MKYSPGRLIGKYVLLICLLWGSSSGFAQTTLPNTKPRDTSLDKTNTGRWKNEEAKVSFIKLNSAKVYTPDTSIHIFQRRPFVQPWARDLGNLGAPAYNLLFTPYERSGPSLGYHIFDVYRFNVDSLSFYTTSRPYSVFNYQLGSKLEQTVGIFHTQNIRPNWNVALNYRKINAPGSYKTQRNNHDNFSASTGFKSLNKHYTLFAAAVYNKEQHDENGGISNYNDLSDPIYNDRKTIETPYQSTQYSLTRSPVFNVQRDFTFLLQHSYAWGITDTLYDDDDTLKYSYTLTPRFSITHKLEISTELHTYKDLAPDSINYTTLFNRSFANNGSGYYAAGGDSVYNQQKWFWVDNQVLFNGFLGREGRQLKFSAGPGIRYDQFTSSPVANVIADSLPKLVYSTGYDRQRITSSYLTGEVKKEALIEGQWEYGAAARLYAAGQYAGNFTFNASIGRQLRNSKGSFVAGFSQQLNSAPYSYTNYENMYTKQFFSFNKESVSCAYASLDLPRLRFSAGVRGYVINNYIYIAETGLPAQYAVPFTLPQAWVKKVFHIGSFVLDNELVYQQVTGNTPVNVPALMGRHQLSFERALFNNAIKFATGVEVRYNTAYNPAGYSAILNQFFYQSTVNITNTPELSVFFNFRIKRFRAYIMGDNLQQLFSQNAILYTGTLIRNYHNTGVSSVPVYAMPNTIIRFGFAWALVN